MCGIAGIVGALDRGERERRVARSLSRLAHRGPDGSRQVSMDAATLGHTRLAIIDLRDDAAQPMPGERDDLLLVFNGEIYNHLDLRADLEGHRFRSRMDGEVILHLYEEKREALVDSLLGMFAFALWDSGRGRLVLARDRFGQKPLSYALVNGSLAFASEIPALLHLLGEVPAIDRGALREFLYFQYIHGPRTAFEGIRQVPPSHVLTWEPATGSLNLRSYFEPFRQSQAPVAGALAGELFLEELKRATASQLVADVPLGVFLSGGIDSGSIAWAATEARDQVETFTAAFDDPAYNEAPQAKATASLLGTGHREFPVTADARDLLPRIVRSFGNPFADPSMLPTWELARTARQAVKVALAGDGADEILAGYDRLRALSLASDGAVRLAARLVRGLLPPPRRDVRSMTDRFLRFLRNAGSRDLAGVNLSLKLKWDPSVDEFLFSDGFIAGACGSDPSGAYHRIVETILGAGGGDRFTLLTAIGADIAGFLADDILVKADITSMAHGLEVRAPYLDHRFAAFLSTLPLSHRLDSRHGKLILRRAMSDRLPARSVWGRKKGFGIPLARWMRQDLNTMARELLFGSPFIREMFRKAGVERLFEEHEAGRADRSQELWNSMILALWHEGVEAWRHEVGT